MKCLLCPGRGGGGALPCSEISWTEIGVAVASDTVRHARVILCRVDTCCKTLPFLKEFNRSGPLPASSGSPGYRCWCRQPVLVLAIPGLGWSGHCLTGVTPSAVCIHVKGVCSQDYGGRPSAVDWGGHVQCRGGQERTMSQLRCQAGGAPSSSTVLFYSGPPGLE